MDRARRVKVSKLLSLALRHDPAALALALDASGWVAVDDVLAGLARQGMAVSRADLEEVVATSDKQRFALSSDLLRIRANQGHSVDVDLGLAPEVPPEILLHGTTADVEGAIRREGLRPGQRAHVHLSADAETAWIVARRRRGPHVILHVRARAMHDGGRAFFRSANGVWLTEHVPPEYVLPGGERSG
ncbi:MAG: RNA 2'-phosphotransferase [Deltaproteobacteria bacterium]|nr:RNA 2'-phosphotransferase [Deltaproteobacteria bacterium]